MILKQPRWFITGILFLSAVSLSHAQAPAMRFETDDHDFGVVPEEGGPISHPFTFVNTGDAPLLISEVKASCGCTTPSWSKEPIAPGDTGVVVAQYNPQNRPGTFRKSITVTSNADPATRALYIKGVVNPKPKTPIDDYPTAMGNLRVKYQSLNMAKVLTKEPLTKSFEMYNDGPDAILFNAINVTPPHITVDVEPKELLPRQKGFIRVTYDATQAVEQDRLGFSTDRIRLYTNEADSVKEFTVMATVEEYFEPLTDKELRKAPKISFASKTHDFGTIAQDAVAKTEFTFTNTGKDDLHIRSTKANCGCTVSQPDKKVLESGESSTIAVTFNAQGRRGKQQKTITVFSDDPVNPTQQLTIKARVNAGE